MSDLPLVAIGVAIWIVAISVAFGFYLPVLRAERRAGGRLLRGFASSRRGSGIAAYQPARPAWTGEDLDHAAVPASASSTTDPAAPPAISEPVSEPLAAPVLVVSAPPEPSPRMAAACTRPEAFSVLIVDDNAINRQVLELILDSVGIAHASVENGLEAVEAMTTCAHDAILMDLQMPVMDGFEATRRIRALEARRGGSPARIIVVSANCLDEDVVASRQAGADAHLAKPISAGVLIGQVEDCATIARLAA
ncbi:MAG TPA: response regulator [Phenylobacterium sp.]|uniref:response regulator n=1 Tax=Phenylobacterium sp. TaxID=1871053 RepID=UPI002D746334|nr:response regulator [Phenylobacterium sp.]HZZ69548.1 response regulator [Phenylobacterium sp.]